jgi:hypothetical protein
MKPPVLTIQEAVKLADQIIAKNSKILKYTELLSDMDRCTEVLTPKGVQTIEVTSPYDSFRDLTRLEVGADQIEVWTDTEESPTAPLGIVLPYEGIAPAVVINKTLNRCWRRFVVAKELAHLFTGLCEDLIDAEKVTISSYYGWLPPHQDVDVTKSLSDETFCIYLAIELLVPYCSRADLDSAATNYLAKTTQQDKDMIASSAATKRLVPREIIKYFLEGYLQVSNKMRNS